jgi:hypothetical protein
MDSLLTCSYPSWPGSACKLSAWSQGSQHRNKDLLFGFHASVEQHLSSREVAQQFFLMSLPIFRNTGLAGLVWVNALCQNILRDHSNAYFPFGTDWESSMSIATKLIDRRIRVPFPEGAGDYSALHSYQAGSGTHPSSYRVGTGSCFYGSKAARAYSWPLNSIGSVPPLLHTPSWCDA